MKLTIGAREFASKRAAADAIRTVLYAYKHGQTLTPEHAAFVGDVLERHPEREQKIGAGVASFQVQDNGGTMGFWLTRIDGSRTDFSFLSCLSAPSAAQKARAAFRREIRDQIVAFRAAAFDWQSLVPCAVSGELVSIGNAHVDHCPTFESLLRDFESLHLLTLDDVAVEPTRDGETDTRLADRDLAKRWADYHREHARLRIVSARANLSMLKRVKP